MNKMFKSRLLSIESKVKLYIKYIRLIAAYGYEVWSTTKNDGENLLKF